MYRSPQVRTQEGGEASPRKIFVPTGKLCWTYFQTIGHSLKNCPLLESSSPPLVSQLVTGLEVQQMFSFPFSLLKHDQIPEFFYVKNSCF